MGVDRIAFCAPILDMECCSLGPAQREEMLSWARHDQF